VNKIVWQWDCTTSGTKSSSSACGALLTARNSGTGLQSPWASALKESPAPCAGLCCLDRWAVICAKNHEFAAQIHQPSLALRATARQASLDLIATKRVKAAAAKPARRMRALQRTRQVGQPARENAAAGACSETGEGDNSSSSHVWPRNLRYWSARRRSARRPVGSITSS